MTHTLTLKSIEPVTHDTYHLVFDRPEGFDFVSGQATHMALDRDGWREEDRPFTMTSQPEDAELHFVIKSYPEHDGVTEQIPTLAPGDTAIAEDPAGAITDRGPGTFIAGGAGITPFIPILRRRDRDGTLGGCSLIFSNAGEKDVILRAEWGELSTRGLDLHLTLTDKPVEGFEHGKIDREFLKSRVATLDQRFYVCGPRGMVNDIRDALTDLGVAKDNLVVENGW